ncbi:MAG: ArsA-related P-loop ATPase, partial [Gaiellales bacterium]
IVTGKGGVGRSAVAAGLALGLAGAGHRTLAISMASPGGLAAHLATPSLGPEPVDLRPGLCAAAVDPRAALDEYVRLRVRAAPLRAAGRIFGALAQTVPGIRDIIVIGKCIHEADAGGWDSVVVDGLPTGQIQSMLNAPAVIRGLVPRGSVHDQARSLGESLATDTGLVVVSTPEELAVTEATALVTAVLSSGVTQPPTLIFNQVLDDPGFATPPPEPGSAADAAALHLDLRRDQQRIISSRPDGCLPFVFGARRPVEVAEHLARELIQ